jgi:methyl-accepting chemotaxis protein
MKKLSLKKKLWFCCGSLLAILLAVAGIGYKSALTTQTLVGTVQAVTHKQTLASAIELAIEKEKVGGRDAVLHGDPAYLSSARAEAQKQVEALRPLLTTPTSRQLVDRIETANAAYSRFVDEEVRLQQAGNQAQAVDLMYGQTTQQAREELRKSTEELVSWFDKQASEAEMEQVASSKQAAEWILMLSIFGLALGSVVAVLVMRSLIASIQPIVEVLTEIANHNLCVQDIEVGSNDELGQAGAALNEMKNNLSRLVYAITHSAEQLAAATEEIAMGAKQSSEGAHREADQAVQAASAMQEMSASVSEVANHARQAHDAASHSAEAARAGGKVAEETLATMGVIAASTQEAAERVTALGKSSEQIGNIVAVITEIAGQTNLLALNAAIEAARAGEQGRGFAVVAGEVRRLAERTATATKEIAGMIETIQQETRVAVAAIEKGNREVELGVQKTGESGQALERIIRESEVLGGMVAQIATAASQQQGAVEQVSVSVSHISDLTQSSSINADQTAGACGNLSQLASELHRLVNAFCVGESSQGLKKQTIPNAAAKAVTANNRVQMATA